MRCVHRTWVFTARRRIYFACQRVCHVRPRCDGDYSHLAADESSALSTVWRRYSTRERAGPTTSTTTPPEIVLPSPCGDDDGAPLDVSERCTVLDTIDPYAQAKITNFIRRQLGDSAYTCETQSVQGATTSAPQFYARVRLPVPARFGERFGEGYAPTAKAAEQVACMHAERVLDALGIPVFELASKQQRHARSAALAGRPTPRAAPLDAASMPSPPPLQLETSPPPLPHTTVPALSVGQPLVPLLRHTLASPYCFDGESTARVRAFFHAQKVRFELFSRILPVASAAPSPSGPGTPGGTATAFVAQIRLPIAPRFGDRLCSGVASTHKEAMALACMHAELTIDALGLSLFPGDADAQQRHAVECRQLGRWATTQPGLELRYDAATPPALRCTCAVEPFDCSSPTRAQSVYMVAAHPHAARAPPVSRAEMDPALQVLLHHSDSVSALGSYFEVDALEPDAKGWILSHLTKTGDPEATPATTPAFFVTPLGMKGRETYRASLLVERSGVAPTFVAIGIATTPDDAETAAAMHARALLETSLAADTLDGEAAEGGCGRADRPCAVRYVRDHVGRVIVPGLRAEQRTLSQQYRHSPGLSTVLDQAASYMATVDDVGKELHHAQTALPPRRWSLETDGEQRIIVSPHATTEGAPNYVHTLPGVREPDAMVVVRLRDYLERHGKDLESSLRIRVAPHEDLRGVSRWTVTVRLPIPSARVSGHRAATTASSRNSGSVVAHGEAHSLKDAVTMCAVHAELLIDALGVPLYDHPILQRKHADAARKLGRWATLRGHSTSNDALAQPAPSHASSALPAPVRKEHALSPVWLRLEKEVRQRESTAGPAAHDHRNRVASPPGSAVRADDALCDLAQLRRFHSTEVFGDAIKHAQFLYHSRGGDFFRAMRQYNVHTGAHGTVHRAIVELPLPASYGPRTAVGCATTKRLASVACAMHALAVVGALSIPVYNGRRQSHLALALAQCGVPCPQPGAALASASTPSPAGFFLMQTTSSISTGGGGGGLEIPEPPSTNEEELRQQDSQHQMWSAYTHACKTYIAALKEADTFSSVSQMHRAPRSGIVAEDNGLDAVERLPVDTHAKRALKLTCAQCHLPAPLFPFQPRRCGEPTDTLYLCEARVRGTPYHARGFGRTSQESAHRCAMHYAYLARYTSSVIISSPDTDGANRPRNGPIGGERAGAVSSSAPVDSHESAHHSWDRSLVDKVQAMDLYARGSATGSVLRVASHERALSATTVMRVLSVELTATRNGETVTGRSSSEVAHGASVGEQGRVNRCLFGAAATRLYKNLETRREDFKHFARTLALATVVHTSCLTALGKEGTASLTDTLGPQDAHDVSGDGAETVPPHCPTSSAVPDAHSPLAAVFSGVAVTVRSSAPFFDSPVVTALLRLTESQLGQSTLPPALAYAASTQATLIGMGFVRDVRVGHGETNSTTATTVAAPHGSVLASTLEVTELGVAVALVVQCIPPLPRAPSSDVKSVVTVAPLRTGSAFPLELAKLLVGAHQLRCPRVGFDLVCELAEAAVAGPDGDTDCALLDVTRHLQTPTHTTRGVVCDSFVRELHDRFSRLSTELVLRAPQASLTTVLTSAPSDVEGSGDSDDRRQDLAMAKLLAVYAATSELPSGDALLSAATAGASGHALVSPTASTGKVVFDIGRHNTPRCGSDAFEKQPVQVGTPIPTLVGAICGTFGRSSHTSSALWPSATVSAPLPRLLAVTLRDPDGTTDLYTVFTTTSQEEGVARLETVHRHWRTCASCLCCLPDTVLQDLCALASSGYHTVNVRGPSNFSAPRGTD